MLKPRVEVREVDGILIAEFWDCLRLDLAPVRDLRDIYEQRTGRDANSNPNVLVDLSGVSFAGSTALGGFVALQRVASKRGGKIVFFHVEAVVREVFKVSNVAPLFRFAETLEGALAFCQQAAEGAQPRPADPSGSPAAPLSTTSPANPAPGTQSSAAPVRQPGPLRRPRRDT